MAKGWESKSVELQIEESQVEVRERRTARFTPGQLDARRRREVLLLSRARVQKDLQASRDHRYSDQLKRALADLDAQIADLADIA